MASGSVYEYEPEEAEILAELLPRNVSVQIFRALLENVAGEFGAKMSAMDSATRNAGDVIDKLTILRKDRKSTRLNSSHVEISYAVFCLKKKKKYVVKMFMS